MELDFCLICASECQPPRQMVNAEVTVKRERIDEDNLFITADHHGHSESVIGEEHLKPFFVLHNILKVPKETLDEFNCEDANNEDPLSGIGIRVPLCPPCGERARRFHETFEKIARLQVTLNDIGREFNDKIQRNKDVECEGSSSTSIWEQIRRQVLVNAASEDPPAQPFEPEVDDDVEEDWHFGDTLFEEEIPVKLDDEESTFAAPTFPMTSRAYSYPFYDDTSTLDIAEEVEMGENLSSGSPVPPHSKKPKSSESQDISKSGKKWLRCPNCPYRTIKTKQMDAHFQLHETGSRAVRCTDCGWYLAPDKLATHRAYFHKLSKGIRKMKKKAATPQPALDLQCAYCPHKVKDITNYKRHQKVHQEDSGATACHACGIFVLPKNFFAHQNYCAHAIRNSLGTDEKLSGAGSNGKIINVNESNPSFISFNRAFHKRKHYKCRQCPYETLQPYRMQVHVEMHEEGSQASLCGECGWFLPSDQLETHRAVNHSAEEIPNTL